MLTLETARFIWLIGVWIDIALIIIVKATHNWREAHSDRIGIKVITAVLVLLTWLVFAVIAVLAMYILLVVSIRL